MKTFYYTNQYYTLVGDGLELWKVAYYPINECGKTGKRYNEPRALIEKPIYQDQKQVGTDFREVPERYLIPINVIITDKTK